MGGPVRIQIRITEAQLRRAKLAAAIRLKSVSHLVSVGAVDLYNLFNKKAFGQSDRDSMVAELREKYPHGPELPRRKTTISVPPSTRECIWGIALAYQPPLSLNDAILISLETEIEDTLTEET
jgi:hypothetical protein